MVSGAGHAFAATTLTVPMLQPIRYTSFELSHDTLKLTKLPHLPLTIVDVHAMESTPPR